MMRVVSIDRNDSLPLPSRPTRPVIERVFLSVFWLVISSVGLFVVVHLITGGLQIVYEDYWIGGFGMLFLSLITCFKSLRRRVIRSFLRPHAGFVCPRCHYTLRRLPDEGICPECGTRYTRASVVGLWEDTYRLGPMFARVTADPSSTAAKLAIGPAKPESPWTKWSLPSALQQVEAIARRHGFAAPRMPIFAQQADAAIHKHQRGLPSDLYSFLIWFDPALWSRFLNTPTPPAQLDSWTAPQDSVAAPAPSDAVVILQPSALTVSTAGELANHNPSVQRFFTHLEQSNPTAATAWIATQLIHFADGPHGPIYYATDPPSLPRGGIVTFSPDRADRLWLADSLGQWLTRLAACDGIDLMLMPDAAHQLSDALRGFVAEDTATRNAPS